MLGRKESEKIPSFLCGKKEQKNAGECSTDAEANFANVSDKVLQVKNQV